MAEKGNPWLLTLLDGERERKNGQVKPYLDHAIIEDHKAKTELRDAYFKGIKDRIKAERVAALPKEC